MQAAVSSRTPPPLRSFNAFVGHTLAHAGLSQARHTIIVNPLSMPPIDLTPMQASASPPLSCLLVQANMHNWQPTHLSESTIDNLMDYSVRHASLPPFSQQALLYGVTFAFSNSKFAIPIKSVKLTYFYLCYLLLTDFCPNSGHQCFDSVQDLEFSAYNLSHFALSFCIFIFYF
jgi:hypothetical protein